MTELVGENLTLGRRVVNANFRLNRGEIVAIVGPNGSGKSSLMRLVSNQCSPDNGIVRLNNIALSRMTPIERARHLAYLPQQLEIAWPIKVQDMVALGRFAFGYLPSRAENLVETVHKCLEEMGIPQLALRSTATLSGGELALASLARILASEAPLMLLDEPMAALDPAFQIRSMSLLRKRAQLGHGLAISLHDLNLAAKFADRIIWMQNGEIAAETGTGESELRRQIIEIFDVRPSFLRDESGKLGVLTTGQVSLDRR